jgi:tight adherence protein B
MADILGMPELWIGLALFLGAGWAVLGRGGAQRKLEERIKRVTHRAPAARTTAAIASLRRQRPQSNAFGKFLENFSSIEKLQGRLEIAGMTTTPQKFLGIAGGLFLGTFILIAVLLGKSVLLAFLLALIAGLGIPHTAVGRKIKKRKLQFLKLFPEAIDLIVRGLRAGLPVAEAFQVIAKEIPPPVGNTFATISQQTQLGLPMERALADTAERLDMTEFNFFVTTIILQRETGGNLGEILSNLSSVLRERQMMKLKIGALSSEARASAYIVGALPFVVFAMLEVISPKYLEPLFNDFRGNLSLAVAGLMLLVGGFIMKKMTELEI